MMFKSEREQRIYLIDALRFLAASWVMLFHFNEPIPYINNWYRNFCKLGYLGVPAFFLISGYCICIAASHSKTPAKFFINRLFRIIPPYWFSLAVVLACVLIQKIITGTNSVTPLPKTIEGILCILFLCTKPITNYDNINWVYWTLSYELIFYLVFFLALYLQERVRVIAFIVILITISIAPRVSHGILSFTDQINIFFLGVALFNLLKKRDYLILYASLMLTAIAVMLITHQSAIWCLTSLVAAMLILIDRYYPLKNNIISKYGDASYAMYLIHVPVGIGLLGFLKNRLIQTNIYLNIVMDVALLLLIVFLSCYIHRFIEKPFIKWGKNITSNKTR